MAVIHCPLRVRVLFTHESARLHMWMDRHKHAVDVHTSVDESVTFVASLNFAEWLP